MHVFCIGQGEWLSMKIFIEPVILSYMSKIVFYYILGCFNLRIDSKIQWYVIF